MELNIIRQCVKIIHLAESSKLQFMFGDREVVEDLLQLVIDFLENRMCKEEDEDCQKVVYEIDEKQFI